MLINFWRWLLYKQQYSFSTVLCCTSVVLIVWQNALKKICCNYLQILVDCAKTRFCYERPGTSWNKSTKEGTGYAKTACSRQVTLSSLHVQEVMHIFCPASHTCVRCSINWHWFKSCHFQAVIYCPPGVIAGFVRRVFVHLYVTTFFLRCIAITRLDNDTLRKCCWHAVPILLSEVSSIPQKYYL